jgi:hypothetical protein
METEKEVNELKEILEGADYKPIVSPLRGFKTKSGEVISWKEAGRRWKVGMQNLTPKQRTQNDILSTWITLIGFIISILALFIFSEKLGVVTYGIIIIFIGSIYANSIKQFSLYGQLNVFKNIEKQFEIELEDVNKIATEYLDSEVKE